MLRLLRQSATLNFEVCNVLKDYIFNEVHTREFKNLKIGRCELAKMCKSENFYHIFSNLRHYRMIKYYPFHPISEEKNKFNSIEYFKRGLQFAKKHNNVYTNQHMFHDDKILFENLVIVYWVFIFISSHKKIDFKLFTFCKNELLSLSINGSKQLKKSQNIFEKLMLVKNTSSKIEVTRT